MAKHTRTLTDEEREQRRAQQRELVRASVEQLRSSDGWQAYLKARARFHSYSWRNVLLILHQHPTAQRVAGFRAWLDLGYCPMKGSKAIRIWAPCPPTTRQLQAWRDAGADPDEKPRGGFKLISGLRQVISCSVRKMSSTPESGDTLPAVSRLVARPRQRHGEGDGCGLRGRRGVGARGRRRSGDRARASPVPPGTEAR